MERELSKTEREEITKSLTNMKTSFGEKEYECFFTKEELQLFSDALDSLDYETESRLKRKRIDKLDKKLQEIIKR